MNFSRSISAVLIATTGLALFATVTARGAERGILHIPNDEDTTSILPTGDVDTWVFDAPAGATLTLLKVKAAPKVSLIPVLTMRDPDGVTVSAARLTASKYKPGKSSFNLKKFGIDKSGRWAVDITNEGANQAGAYTLSTKIKYPKKFKDKGFTIPEGAARDVTVPLAGGVTFSVSFKRKSGGEDIGTPILFDPDGNTVFIPSTLWTVTSKGISTPLIELPLSFGDYTLRFPGPSSGGAAAGILTLTTKWPKRKKVKHTISSDEPRLTAVTPAQGNFGTSIRVDGTNFAPGAELLVGDTAATNVVRNINGTQLTGIVPQGAGTVGISVFNPDDQGMTLDNAFTYLPPPTLVSVVPNEGTSAGGTPVTITGSNFRAGMRVYFGARQVLGTVTVVNSTTLTFTTDETPSGLYSVEVRDASGQSASLSGAFTFLRALRRVTGAFSGTQSVGARVSAAAVGDLDGDGLDNDFATTFNGVLYSGEDRIPAAGMFFGQTTMTMLDRTTQAWNRPFWPTVTLLPGLDPDFVPRYDFGAGEDIAIGDLDGDGDDDMVVVANGFYSMNLPLNFLCPADGSTLYRRAPYSGIYQTAYSGTRMFINDGGGRFNGNAFIADSSGNLDSPWPFPIWGEWFQAQAVAIGDMDGDQDLDLVITTNDDFPFVRLYNDGTSCTLSPSPYSGALRSSAMRILTNDGKAKFSFTQSVVGTTLESFQGVDVAIGDLDGDTDNDIVVCDEVPPLDGLGNPVFATRVVMNEGAQFQGSVGRLPLATELDNGRANSLAVRDLNGDNRPDIVIATRDVLTTATEDKASTRILLNDGAGNFTDVTDLALPAIDIVERWQADGIEVGDLDGDGDADLALVLDGTIYDGAYTLDWLPSLRVLLNNGSGVFARPEADFMPQVDLVNGGYPSFLTGEVVRFGDLDGDGDRDVIIGTSNPVEDSPDSEDVSPALEIIRNR